MCSMDKEQVYYHKGYVQSADTGKWYVSDCLGKLLPVYTYLKDGDMFLKTKCQKCWEWVVIKKDKTC